MSTRTLAAVWLLIVAQACSGEDNVRVTFESDTTEAEPGTAGGACLEGNTCLGETLACFAGTCREPVCVIGDPGCACYANQTCSKLGDGSWGFCDNGLCRAPTCTQGALGCGCFSGGTCDEGLFCSDASGSPRCEMASCAVGDLGCGCKADRTCNAADGVPLVCDGALCVTPTCAQGSNGCACKADFGCDAGLACGDDLKCGPADCARGSLGCACLGDGACDSGLFCGDDGTCQSRSCAQGTLDCGCFGDFTCTAPGDGSLLVCQQGICKASPCTPGAEGCGCLPSGACGAGLACESSRCVTAGCNPGTVGCGCSAGTCEIGAICQNGVCVESIGMVGGECYANGTCSDGARCDNADDHCVACAPGSAACSCFGNDTCVQGLVCAAGRCIAETGVIDELRNKLDTCYSPCTESVELADGTFIPCSSSQLMAYCMDGTTCVQGSCVPDGQGPRTCGSDLDCPTYQACIEGQCWSECDYDSQCADGLHCYQKVCRQSCLASESVCPSGNACLTVDGEAGFCMPTPVPEGPVVSSVDGQLQLTHVVLEFTNVSVKKAFTIINASPRSADVHVDYTRQTHPDPLGGVITDTEHPLTWMTMGLAAVATLTDPYQAEAQAVATTTVPATSKSLHFTLGPNESRIVVLDKAYNDVRPLWDGQLVVSANSFGAQTVALTYRGLPEGQWRGNIYYFANFRDSQIDQWEASHTSQTAAANTQNAFIAGWTRFRAGQITMDEFKALLNATVQESWNYPSVREVCARPNLPNKPGANRPNGACYLYDNTLGFSVYSEDVNQLQVPSGAVQLPFAMNIKPATAGSLTYTGRINSDTSLQYAGLPAVQLRFANSPASPTCTGGSCKVDIAQFDSTITVGARYASTSSDTKCTSVPEGSYQLAAIPWFVPGFLRDTVFDSSVALNFRYDCRDQKFPFADDNAVNANLAGANPIPDGRRRIRHIELLDGLLVDQQDMILLVREWFEPFMGEPSGSPTPDISAYAVIRLSRGTAALEAADYVGNAVVDNATPGFEPGLLKQCSADIIDEVLHRPMSSIDPITDAATIANALITGVATPPADNSHLTWSPTSLSDTQVHYYCEDTGTFDQGSPNNGAYPIPCPVGSRVTYFTTRGITQSQIDNLPCQTSAGIEFIASAVAGSQGVAAVVSEQPTFRVLARGTCQDTLNTWVANNRYETRLDPRWQCEDPEDPGHPTTNSVLCDAVRLDPEANYDLRESKLFYGPTVAAVPYVPIESAIADAFRYRVRFKSALGRPVGFVPSMCQPGSDLEPYCYDPAAIDQLSDRVDCLLDIFNTYYPQQGFGLDLATVTLIENYLTTHFSYVTAPERCVQMGGTAAECSVLDPLLHYDGFERHFAELHVMLGDDAFTRALGSRFDLAGISVGTFKGSLLEPDGIDLTGGAGYQMVLLYKATQYYERVLDRFYALSPYLWKAGSPQGAFVTPGTVSSYMGRVALASTKLSRVWNEISRRYQGFNRPDLARRVIERGYTRAYLESIALTRMMQKIIATAPPAARAEVQQAIEEAQRRYRIAMLDMADAYVEITNDINFFGFTADYIPFPGLRPSDVSAVHLLLERAWDQVQRASSQEDQALESTRSFDTDTAQFQAELQRVANTYEDQLGEICGTFTAANGKVYPATSRYVDLIDTVKYSASMPPVLTDPCGLLPSGSIYETRLRLDQQAIAADALVSSYDSTIDEINAVKAQVQERCNISNALALFEYSEATRTITLEDEIRDSRNEVTEFQAKQSNVIQKTKAIADAAVSCLPKITITTGFSPSLGTEINVGACAAASSAVVANFVAGTETVSYTSKVNEDVADKEHQISEIQRNMAFKRSQSECQFASLEATGQIRGLWTRLNELRIQMLQQQYDSEITLSQLKSLRNRASRLDDQQSDAQQVLINVEAAKNDPNVRIYQNAAVIRADRSFNEALRDVYSLTRVYEYYTSTSYPKKEQLFLIRMVAHGEDNLEDYLVELENAFFDFEASFGPPNTRVALLSLRDDILEVPRYDDAQQPLSQADRIGILRDRLASSEFIDRWGYIAVPFSTSLDALSPLTRNHKVLYVEAEIIGSDIGDQIGRVYLRQRGTGTVRGVGDDKLFYAFPEIIAVLNPFFNGQRVFAPEVYRNDRLRDRPFANTQWELVLNQLDESVNKDINLNSLTDVRVYVYYTDFTEL